MSSTISTPPTRTGTGPVTAAAGRWTTARPLSAGVAAGPLFLTVGLAQAFTRPGGPGGGR